VEDKNQRAGPIRRFQDLLSYQQAYRLALDVSKLTRTFPKQEQWELGRQIRASSRSIAANIVEGWAKRESAAEFRRHLQISVGECAETRFWLTLAVDEGLAPKSKIEPTEAEYAKLGMMIHHLWKEWRKFEK
jgi:four helix bundle protein